MFHFSRKKSALIVVILTGVLFLTVLFLSQCARDENARFEDYTDALFRQEVSANAITLHYTLKNPSLHRIYDMPLSLGQVSTDTDAIGAAAENALAYLHKYDPLNLSPENQLIYNLLENSFSSSRDMAPFALYEEPLSPLTGTQAQLPVLLSEYQFYSLSDVRTYLRLLKEMPDYYDAILDFERAKADAGLFMSDARAEAVIEECEAFAAMGESHYLHETFEGRLKELMMNDEEDLSQDTYEQLIAENARYIEEHVYPAYEMMAGELRNLLGNCTNEHGLSYFPDGKSYYELLVREATGSERTILELMTMAYEQIVEDMEGMQAVMDEMSDVADSSIFEDSNPASILASLKDAIAGNFPEPPSTDISVKYVEESLEDFLSPAFYLIPAIDNLKENVIYINPKHMSDDLTLFTTLAHEGYPGHMYQTTYFHSLSPAPIRCLLRCDGYVEGWATYCEMMSYYFAPVSKAEATFLQKNASVMLGLYALADMGIHYKGWTLSDTIDFFSDYGIYDAGAVSEIYDLILGDPANYLKYYVGYLEFLELKKEAIATWGEEFSQERFHREVLTAGPMPFWRLREEMM